MDITNPAIEIIIHNSRLSGEVETRHIRGCLRAALIDKAKTKHQGQRFVTVVKHSDMDVYLVDDDMMTGEELANDRSLLPVAVITTI